jgi:hypothetical protein
MTNDDFDRLNTLADKALKGCATDNELKEFSQLLSMWNISTSLNLFNGHHSLQQTFKLCENGCCCHFADISTN